MLRIFDTYRKLSNGKLEITSAIFHPTFLRTPIQKVFLLAPLKKFKLNFSRWLAKKFPSMVPKEFHSQWKCESINEGSLLFQASCFASFLRLFSTTWMWIRVFGSRCWPSGFTVCEEAIAASSQISWKRMVQPEHTRNCKSSEKYRNRFSNVRFGRQKIVRGRAKKRFIRRKKKPARSRSDFFPEVELVS